MKTYKDNAMNRRLGRVGLQKGSKCGQWDKPESKPKKPPPLPPLKKKETKPKKTTLKKETKPKKITLKKEVPKGKPIKDVFGNPDLRQIVMKKKSSDIKSDRAKFKVGDTFYVESKKYYAKITITKTNPKSVNYSLLFRPKFKEIEYLTPRGARLASLLKNDPWGTDIKFRMKGKSEWWKNEKDSETKIEKNSAKIRELGDAQEIKVYRFYINSITTPRELKNKWEPTEVIDNLRVTIGKNDKPKNLIRINKNEFEVYDAADALGQEMSQGTINVNDIYEYGYKGSGPPEKALFKLKGINTFGEGSELSGIPTRISFLRKKNEDKFPKEKGFMSGEEYVPWKGRDELYIKTSDVKKIMESLVID